jgi:hypothetical protein
MNVTVKIFRRIRSSLTLIIAGGSLLIAAGCSLIGPGDEQLEEYDTRILEYMVDVDEDPQTDYVLRTLKAFDGVTKLQKAETVNSYENLGTEEDPDYQKTETLVYEFDPQTGVKTANPVSRIEYAYTGTRMDRADTYDSEDNPVYRLEVLYENANYPEKVTTNRTFVYDGGSYVEDSEQIITYYNPGAPDTDWEGNKRTEQFFYFDGGTKKLRKETVYWYDETGELITHTVEHLFRGGDDDEEGGDVETSEVEEFFIYKSYSYNAQNQIFQINDHEYDETAGAPTLESLLTGDGYFDVTPGNSDPFVYDIEHAAILGQRNLIIYDYTDLEDPDPEAGAGALLLGTESHYTEGVLQEERRYTYDSRKRLTGIGRYVNGGRTLAEKEVTIYRDVVYRLDESGEREVNDDGEEVIASFTKETLEYTFEVDYE